MGKRLEFMANFLGVACTDRGDQIIVGEASGCSAGAIHAVGTQGSETSSMPTSGLVQGLATRLEIYSISMMRLLKF